jgi:hypothetical protein
MLISRWRRELCVWAIAYLFLILSFGEHDTIPVFPDFPFEKYPFNSAAVGKTKLTDWAGLNAEFLGRSCQRGLARRVPQQIERMKRRRR